MKNCIECNEQLEDDAKFCSNCRARQPEKKVEPEETKPVKKVTAKKQEQKTITVKKQAVIKPEKKELSYQEQKQAIYDMTPQDNCGECGCKNCMQFAMQAASPKNSMELSDCPYIDEDEAEEFYDQYFHGNGDDQPANLKNTTYELNCKHCSNLDENGIYCKVRGVLNEFDLKKQTISCSRFKRKQ